MGHVNANLMCSASQKPAFNKRCQRVVAFCQNLVTRKGRFSPISKYRHLLSIARASADISLYDAFALARDTPNNGDISAFDIFLILGKQGRECPMGCIVLRDHHCPTGVFVEPVHDTRTLHAADPRQAVTTMGQQSIDQCTAFIARSRMNNHPRGFIDHQQIVVFIKDIERDFFGDWVGRDCGWDFKRKAVATFYLV